MAGEAVLSQRPDFFPSLRSQTTTTYLLSILPHTITYYLYYSYHPPKLTQTGRLSSLSAGDDLIHGHCHYIPPPSQALVGPHRQSPSHSHRDRP